MDLTDPSSVADLQKFVAEEHGRLDVLVNNAAVCFNDPTLYGGGPVSNQLLDRTRCD